MESILVNDSGEFSYDLLVQGIFKMLDFADILRIRSLSSAWNKAILRLLLNASRAQEAAVTHGKRSVPLLQLNEAHSTDQPKPTKVEDLVVSSWSKESGKEQLIKDVTFYRWRISYQPSNFSVLSRNVCMDKRWTRMPPALFDTMLYRLTMVVHFKVETCFFHCACATCRRWRVGSGGESDPAPGELLRIAKLHAFDRLSLVYQVAIRNRATLETLDMEEVPLDLTFGFNEDSAVPELNIDFVDESSNRFSFDKLRSVCYGRTVDCRHIVPFLDFCSFPMLTRLEIGTLKAVYRVSSPLFGVYPTVIFGPVQIIEGVQSSENAPHLPAIYNGNVDENLVFKGRGLYACHLYTYEGEFANGYNEGQGRMLASSGEVYEGEWKLGRRSGPGRVTQADGTTMEGMWESDCLNGFATLRRAADGLVYEGTWFQSNFDGWGVLSCRGTLLGYGHCSAGRLSGWARIFYPSKGLWVERRFADGHPIMDGTEAADVIAFKKHEEGVLVWIVRECLGAVPVLTVKPRLIPASFCEDSHRLDLGPDSPVTATHPFMSPTRTRHVELPSPCSSPSVGRELHLSTTSSVSDFSTPQFVRMDAGEFPSTEVEVEVDAETVDPLSLYVDNSYASRTAIAFFSSLAKHLTPEEAASTQTAGCVGDFGEICRLGQLSRPDLCDLPQTFLSTLKQYGVDDPLSLPMFPL